MFHFRYNWNPLGKVATKTWKQNMGIFKKKKKRKKKDVNDFVLVFLMLTFFNLNFSQCFYCRKRFLEKQNSVIHIPHVRSEHPQQHYQTLISSFQLKPCKYLPVQIQHSNNQKNFRNKESSKLTIKNYNNVADFNLVCIYRNFEQILHSGSIVGFISRMPWKKYTFFRFFIPQTLRI